MLQRKIDTTFIGDRSPTRKKKASTRKKGICKVFLTLRKILRDKNKKKISKSHFPNDIFITEFEELAKARPQLIVGERATGHWIILQKFGDALRMVI